MDPAWIPWRTCCNITLKSRGGSQVVSVFAFYADDPG